VLDDASQKGSGARVSKLTTGSGSQPWFATQLVLSLRCLGGFVEMILTRVLCYWSRFESTWVIRWKPWFESSCNRFWSSLVSWQVTKNRDSSHWLESRCQCCLLTKFMLISKFSIS